MSNHPPIFDDYTTRLTIQVHKKPDGAAVITIRPFAAAGEQPAWDVKNGEQARDLAELIKISFGRDYVGTLLNLDRQELTVHAADAETLNDHANRVVEKVKMFVQQRQMELDTNDENHFRGRIDAAAAERTLRDGVLNIVRDQLLDHDQKADAIMELVSQKRAAVIGGAGGHN